MTMLGMTAALAFDHKDLGLGIVGAEIDRPGPEIAVRVGADDLDDGDFGQFAGGAEAAVFSAIDGAIALQLLQQGFQRDPIGAFQMEGAGDLALADRRRTLADEGENLLLGREGRRFLAVPFFRLGRLLFAAARSPA
jgi:hypothetical protein